MSVASFDMDELNSPHSYQNAWMSLPARRFWSWAMWGSTNMSSERSKSRRLHCLFWRFNPRTPKRWDWQPTWPRTLQTSARSEALLLAVTVRTPPTVFSKIVAIRCGAKAPCSRPESAPAENFGLWLNTITLFESITSANSLSVPKWKTGSWSGLKPCSSRQMSDFGGLLKGPFDPTSLSTK